MSVTVLSASPFAVAGLFCLVLISGVIALIWVSARRQQSYINQLRERLDTFERDALVQHQRVQAMAQQLVICEATLTRVNQSPPSVAEPEHTKNTAASDEFSAYNEATHWLEMGLPIDEVMRRSGLSRAEASLLETMWRLTPS